MAATDDKINVQIEAELTGSFQDQLNKVSELSKKVPLGKKEQGNYNAAMRGAQLSLNSGDIKGFQQNFNKIVDILRTASLSTGKLNAEIDEYTKKIEELSKAVNKRKERLTDIDTKYYGADAKKAGLLKDQEITKIKESYGDIAKKITNQQIRDLIAQGFNGKPLKDINLQHKLPDNLGMSSRDEAKTFVKIAREVQAKDQAYQKERSQLVHENSADTQAMHALEEEIRKIQAAAPAAASELEKVYLELSKLKNNTNQAITDQKNAGKMAKSAADDVRSNDKESQSLEQQHQRQATSFGKLVKNMTLYHIALRTVRNTMRSAIHTIKELDKQLTEQAMVVGKTRQETYQLLKGYQDLAKNLGATTKEVAQVATEYLRQGKTTAEAMKLTEAAISAAKVASINTAESVNYLTTALNGFRLSASDAMKVSDKFAAVAASAAVSYEEIATALSKVASQANLAGMSIDYTTAILAKGIETTREAPETIGTALKTVIARMREIKDYGETLGDGIDLNNVESQLAYVGIELRSNSGELRSTEDVLDDLGKKWDSLNSNQQAAIAKALAGTRQQSRLISMMNDYERVIELQEIAEQSQGATVAQMAVYTEGLEAALNKVAVSWEKIVTTVSNSEVIINMVNMFSSVLNIINEILSNDALMVGLLVTMGVLAIKYVGTKMREKIEQRQIKKIQQELQAVEAKRAVVAQQMYVQSLKQRKILLQDKKSKGEITEEEKIELATIDQQIQAEEQKIPILEQQATALEHSTTKMGMLTEGTKSFAMGLAAIMAPAVMVINLIRSMVLWMKKLNAEHKKEAKNIDKTTKKEQKKAMWNKIAAAFGMAESASSDGPAGWVIAAGILAVMLGIGIAIAVAMNNSSSSTEKTADKINSLSNEIYNLQKTSRTLDTALSKFEDIDEKVIKTTADIEAMGKTLDEAADSLSSEAGKSVLGWLNGSGKKHKGAQSEQDYYNSLQSNQEKENFLKAAQEAYQAQIKKDQLEQIDILRKASAETREAMFTDAEYASVRDAIYAINNSVVYDTINAEIRAKEITQEYASEIRKFTQSLLENVSAKEAWDYAQNPQKLTELTKTLGDLKTLTSQGSANAIDVLGNSKYSLKEQVKSYNDLKEVLRGDGVAYAALVEQYMEYDVFANMEESVLDFIDKTNLNIDKLNELAAAYKTLQKKGVEITQEDFSHRYNQFLTSLAQFNGDVVQAINLVFGDILAASENYTETWSALITTFGDIIEVGMLDMGQNIDTFTNSIDSFYEKASKWATLSETEKTQFMSDNLDLFTASNGEDLAKALENGDYALMEQSLKANEVFQEKRQRLLDQVEQELKIELGKEESDRNESYIRQLQQTKQFLEDENKVYKANLKTRLEQEQKALDAYKDLLQKRADADKKVLEDRKQAYSDYFTEINQSKDDEDYEEQASKIVANITKLGSSTNADSVKQMAELQDSLEELEKERLETLRERAQEQILSNLDQEINQISNQLDEILNNQQLLLTQLMKASQSPEQLISSLVSQKMQDEGLTQLGFQNYWNELQETFGAFISNFDWSALNSDLEQNDSGNLVLNILGNNVELNEQEQQTIYDAILSALTQLGIR